MSILKRMSVRMRVYGFLVLITMLATGGYFLNRRFNSSQANANPSPEKAKPGDENIVPVELMTATQGQISSFLTATANLRALREVDVASQTEGIVQRVLVEEGHYVKEGQVLCQLDDTQLRIRLQSAQQRLAQAKLQWEKSRIRQDKAAVQIKNTQDELARYQKLYEQKLVSEREVAQLKYRLDELQHDERVSSSEERELTHRVEELEAEIEQVTLEISRTQVKAPFSGYVIQRMVELGRTMRNLEPLFKLGDFSPLYADVHLSEGEARQVRPGQPATINLGIDESVQTSGRVARISPVVDQSTGTVKITVELSRTGGAFKPGAFVRVGIQTDTRANTVLIPKRAVVEEDGEKFVYVASGDTAKRTKVTLGYETDGKVEVRQGLSVGQQVVVAGQGALKEGSKIKVVQTRNQSDVNVRAAL
ncbi:MAG: efflux RND transporter periplasmic adaptor subunit [Acidobacteria bacterium]|nr:efflux RND transporter periplasmic adaptor subunit [Acidobacteriota bacterium]